MRAALLTLTLLGATAPTLAQTSPTVQQRFDTASKLLNIKQASEALAAFTALETDLLRAPKPNPTSLALARVRKASAYNLLARGEEAKASLRLALAGTGFDAPALHGERDTARLMLARIHEFELDYAGAAAEYERLAQSGAPATKATAFAGLARSSMFFDAPAAVLHAEAALALLPSATEEDRKYLASGHSVLGRALLNAGRLSEARKAFDRAIALRGGLDQRVDASEVAMRSDAAIAALRAGDSEAARRLLAYTGAGRSSTTLPFPAVGEPPACGGIDGLAPEDMAIVQFALLKDGSVAGAAPVYATRQGGSAIAFAQAVSGWTWSPETIAKISTFDRLAVRVELRCTNALARPSIKSGPRAALAAWFASQGTAVDLGEANASKRAKASRVALAAAQGQAIREAAYRTELVFNPSVGWDETVSLAKSALAAVRGAKAPANAWIALAMIAVPFDKPSAGSSRPKQSAHVEALLRDPEIVADPVATATLKLVLVELADRNDARARILAGEVANDPRIVDRDPLKIAALLTVANASIAAGDRATAEDAYRRTGLSARQCATLDQPPKVRKNNVSDNDFPMAAIKWGFEGWTRQEHDVTPDGRTTNIRTVMAYPPSVFAEASEEMAKGIRYEPSFRPEGGLGCGGVSQRIRFQYPD